jgi:hypothetical protein
MAGRLTMMYGNGNGHGAVFMDPRGKSDFDAGLMAMAAIARMMPGITWGDLMRMGQNPQAMAGWWTNLKKAVGDVKDGIGDVLSDTIGLIGRKGGQVVRLASDEKVASTISRAGAAYSSGGLSEALASLTGGQADVVEGAGASYKRAFGGINWSNPWVIGGSVAVGSITVLSLISFLSGGKKRRR